jgi:hypothetical protein
MILGLAQKCFFYLNATAIKLQEKQTKDELSQKTIEKLMNSFEKIYPEIYRRLIKASEISIQEPRTRRISANKYYAGGTTWAYVVPKDWHKQLGLYDHDNVG